MMPIDFSRAFTGLLVMGVVIGAAAAGVVGLVLWLVFR